MANTQNHTTIGDDGAALESLERKLQVVRDHTRGVATGRKTGLYAWGPPGSSKSYTVLTHLKELNARYKLFNSHMTGKGLFLALKEEPDTTHVLDDLHQITRDTLAQSVLLGALWAQPGDDRIVTCKTNDGEERFVFRGGIIMLANQPLAALGVLRALATRIEVYRLDATDAELTALMLAEAAKGFGIAGKQALAPEVCQQITEYLLQECRASGCPLDLRLQQKSYQTYLQWDAGEAVTHWRDLVTISIREAAHHFRHEQGPLGENQRRWRRNILRAIMQQTSIVSEQLLAYGEQTGASRADFFRKKQQIESGEFDSEDSGAE